MRRSRLAAKPRIVLLGPFGEPLLPVTAGTVAAEMPFRFSTKYNDVETGLYYYGYRYYDPSTGRWLSRDPMEEEGGVALYVIATNAVVNFIDALGREVADVEQEHHPIPYNNKTWNHSDHELIKCAAMNLETDQKLAVLQGHIGKHSPTYHAEVRARLDAAWAALSVKNETNAVIAVNGVVDSIIRDINSGSLKLFSNPEKEVKLLRIIPRSRVAVGGASFANKASRVIRSSRTNIIINVFSIIPGSLREILMIKDYMDSGSSFPDAVQKLWHYYDDKIIYDGNGLPTGNYNGPPMI